jgi:hypothetical protein
MNEPLSCCGSWPRIRFTRRSATAPVVGWLDEYRTNRGVSITVDNATHEPKRSVWAIRDAHEHGGQ